MNACVTLRYLGDPSHEGLVTTTATSTIIITTTTQHATEADKEGNKRDREKAEKSSGGAYVPTNDCALHFSSFIYLFVYLLSFIFTSICMFISPFILFILIGILVRFTTWHSILPSTLLLFLCTGIQKSNRDWGYLRKGTEGRA